MGKDRDIISDEITDLEDLNTSLEKDDCEETSPKTKKKKKPRKVQIWVKKETLEYEQELNKLQIELLKFQNYVKEQG